MSRDWTPEEIQAASAAMKAAGQLGYEEFTAEVEAIDKIVRFARQQRESSCPCPRCGCRTMNDDPIRNALSRRAKVYICDACGTEEALEDFAGQRKPLSSWDIAQKENWPL